MYSERLLNILSSIDSNHTQCYIHSLQDDFPIPMADDNGSTSSSPTTYGHVARGCQVTMFVLAVIGTVTNLLSIATLCSRSLRSQATSIGLIALAIADILVLITCIFRYKVYYIFVLNDRQYLETKFTLEPYFKVYVEPIYWMALGMSSFVVVAVTTQRYLAIRFPFSTRRYCYKAVNIASIILVMLVPVAMCIPHFFYYQILVGPIPIQGIFPHIEIITEFGRNDHYRCVFLQYLLPILWYILPWIYLAVINFLLMYHVHQSAKISHSNSMTTAGAGRGGRGHGSRHSHNLTVLLILLVSTYMFLNLPKCIVTFVRLVTEQGDEACEPGTDGAEEDPADALEVANWIVTVLNVANSTVNFGLYCMFGERFRKEFRRKFLFCKCLQRCFKTAPNASTKNTTLIQGNTVI